MPTVVKAKKRRPSPSSHAASGRDDDDERYFVVDGRRWRRTDPLIPEALRVELVAELTDARRAVAAARRKSDADAEASARTRVKHAKHALGERGAPWWEPATDDALRTRAEHTLHALVQHRGADKTICPSDIARVLSGSHFRAHMALVRELAVDLSARGQIEIRQKGKVVDARSARGPIRIGRKRDA